ncbi:fatty acid-binding protein, brain-like [Ptychodera flava]|uniref:fatty acid-binding protein, brain-like n=1 Tax=Ptychodera flava TaxID=63121 RepID=UPI003969F25D
MSNLVGKWKHVRSENFNEYLIANNVNFVLRSMMTSMTPTLDIQQTGDEFVIRTITMLKTREQKFTIGKEFEEVHWGGDTKKSIATMEDDKLVVKSADDPENNPIIEREVIGDELVMTLRKGDVTAKRYFKKIE